MKNTLAFVFVWFLVSAAYTRLKYANNDERVAVLKVVAVGGLTATLTCGLLTALVILF